MRKNNLLHPRVTNIMEKILIIGNGFDLNLGFQTSYNDFLSSDEFKMLADGDNQLAYYLSETNRHCQQTNINWVDIEHELKTFSAIISGYENYSENQFVSDLIQKYQARFPSRPGISRAELSFIGSGALYEKSRSEQELDDYFNTAKAKFKQWFVELKDALCKHLENVTIDYPQSADTTDAFRVLRFGRLINANHGYCDFNFIQPSQVCEFSNIYTFNYTNALSLIGFQGSPVEVNTNIHFMHGSLKAKNIVFGVEDGGVDNQFMFLTKSAHSAFGQAPDISVAMLKADEIHIFGCSLGDTDNAHFKHPFTELSNRRNKFSKTKIIFYVFGKTGFQNTLNRILFLTNGRMSEFKITNDLIFFDLELHQVIDQQWINQQ